MSVNRQLNGLGQQRFDLPHLRALESSIANDFDVSVGTIIAGQKPLIIKGFNLSTSNMVGKPATSLILNTANGIALHYFASESGSMLSVPALQAAEVLSPLNPNVFGGFVSNNTNYIGIDFIRTPDASTTDTVQFLDAATLVETPKPVPLARTLSYKILISPTTFSAASNICPVAKVTTDVSGNITFIQDARRLMFRLGSGGDFPNASNVFPWAASRIENTASGSDVFAGGDKVIISLKDWCDAVTTRLWEVSGGGDFWYSPTSPQNVKLIKEGSPFVNGDYFSWSGTNLSWQGIRFVFGNAIAPGVYFNLVQDQITAAAGLTDLAVGECVYVDLTRAGNATVVAVKTQLTSLGSPTVPGSRYILAYRGPSGNVFARDSYLPIGSAAFIVPIATTTSNGIVQLSATPGSGTNPLVPSIDASGFAQSIGVTRGATLAAGAGTFTVKGTPTDGSTAVGVITDTSSLLANATAKLLSFRNNGTEKAAVLFDGTFLSPKFDSLTGSITVGSANATSVILGRSGTSVQIATGSSLDSVGASLSIAPSNATSIVIGRTGINTKIIGTLNVVDLDGAVSGISPLNIGATLATGVNIGGSLIATSILGNLLTNVIDTRSATILSIGQGAAVGVAIGHAGTGVIMPGTLNVVTNYQLNGTTVTVFPAGIGALTYGPTGGSALSSNIYTTSAAGVFLDVSGFFNQAGAINTSVNTTLSASAGTVTVTNAGKYSISFSVSMGIPITGTNVIINSARVVVNGAEIGLAANGFTVDGSSGGLIHFVTLGSNSTVSLAAGDVVKLQVANGVTAVPSDLAINNASLNVVRVA